MTGISVGILCSPETSKLILRIPPARTLNKLICFKARESAVSYADSGTQRLGLKTAPLINQSNTRGIY